MPIILFSVSITTFLSLFLKENDKCHPISFFFLSEGSLYVMVKLTGEGYSCK